MRKKAWSGNGVKLLAGLAALAASPAAVACCPSDGHTVASTSSTGMGLQAPDAQNLSVSSYWKAYAFERDGIRYIQANDLRGQVRAAVGYIGSTYWVMPIGTDADRTTIGTGIQTLPGEIRTVVYRSADFELAVYESATGVRWSVVRLAGG